MTTKLFHRSHLAFPLSNIINELIYLVKALAMIPTSNDLSLANLHWTM